MILKSRCRSQRGGIRRPVPRRAPRPPRSRRPTARKPTSTRRVFRPPHARRVGYACVTEPEQRSALNRCTCQKLASRVGGSAPVTRRGATPAALSVRSTVNVRELGDTKYARHKRPVLENAPPPVAARQLLPRRGLLGDQVSVARERRYARLRPAAASGVTTARDAAATAGLTVLTSSCSAVDAAAAPSFASARRREAVDRAHIAITAH